MGDFTAIFSGVCGFAPDVEFNDPNPANNPTKVMVLMPDAVPQSPPIIRRALDGEVLRAHAPFIVFKTGDLVDRGGLPASAESHVFINRKEMSFEIDENPMGSNPFTISQRVPASKEDFSHVTHIKEILKDSTSYPLKKECFKSRESLNIISARIRLEKIGLLAAYGLDTLVEFDFANTLGGGFAQRPLADKVSLRFINVTQVRVVLRDLDTDVVEKLPFNTDGRSVEVDIGNFCGDSLVPVVQVGSPSPVKLTRDEDFRGVYELFHPDSGVTIKQRLNGLPLPIPFPVFVNGGGGLYTVQCMGVALNAQSF